MHSFKWVQAAAAVCLALAASGCHEHSRQSLATGKTAIDADGAAMQSRAAEANAAAERLDAYIGDKFSDTQKALATKPPPDSDIPTF